MKLTRFKAIISPPVLCGLMAFIIYYFTLAPTIAWGNFPIDALHLARIFPPIILSEDSAELAGAAATLGIAHPPGYPLFILLGHLFTKLPLGGDAAYRTNFFSAVCAAVAVAFFWTIVRDVTQRPRAAWLAALLFAFSYTFWEHAVMTEVHALHLLLLTLALWTALRAARTNERRWLCAWAFIFGLGMSNHLTTILFLPGFLVLLFRPLLPAMRNPKLIATLIGCYAAGLLPYLYLPWRAAQNPPFNWGNPSNLERLLALITGSQYRRFLLQDGGERVATWLKVFPLQLIIEFGYVATALGAFGFGWQLWRKWRERKSTDRRERLSPPALEVLVALTLMGVAQWAFALCYHIPDPQALYIPVYLIFAVGIGIGWTALEQSWNEANIIWRGALNIFFIILIVTPLLKEEPHVHGFLGGVEEFLLPPAKGLLLQHPRVSLRQHYMAARYARGVLARLPRDTIFLSSGDGRTFSVWYEQHVHHQRPDVITILRTMLQYPWYRQQLGQQLPALSLLTGKASSQTIIDLLTRHPATQRRPIIVNVPPADWQDPNRLVEFTVPLPKVHPSDTITNDEVSLYRYAPQGTSGIEIQSEKTPREKTKSP